MNLFIIARENTDADILVELNKSAAKTKRNNATKSRIDLSANDQLKAGLCHLFNDDSLNLCIGVVGLHRGNNGIVCGFCLFIRFNTDNHTSCITFVNDLGADDLHNHRIADLCGSCRGGFRTGSNLEERGRHVESPQKVIPVCFGEHFGVGMC